MPESNTKYTSQYIDNFSFDDQLKVKIAEIISSEGNLINPATEETLREVASGGTKYAVKITTSGTTTYIGKATVGSSQASAVWQAKKIAVSGGDTTITFADGNANFDNVATDLTALSYS